MNKHLTDFEKDQVAEIVNIGAGNAATALSHLMGQRVQMDVPCSHVGTIDEVLKSIGRSDDTVLTVYLKMTGDIGGALAVIFSHKAALKFVEVLANTKKSGLTELSESDISSLREVGNILLGASLTALSKFLHLNITHSIPDVAVDMLGAILDSVLIDVGKDHKHVLAIGITLKVSEDDLGGQLFYLFDPGSTEKILEMTGALLSTTSKP